MPLVAIDIAKDWNVLLVEAPDGERRSFKVANRRSDHDELVGFLRGLPGHVRVALEPTGDFHRPLAFRLLSEGFEVVGVSSVAQARFRKARFGTWDKNDPKDAQVILEMLKQGFTQTYYDPLLNGSLDLQELSGTYFQISLARTRLQHSLLLHYLPLYFPEIRRYWHSTRGEWFVRFLMRFPTPASIRALSAEDFVQQAWPLIGRKVGKKAKLAEIYEIAGSSIALPVEEGSMAVYCFRLQLQRYLELTQLRAELDKRAQERLADRADYQRLRSLPGIGPVLALTILAEAGDLRRFAHHRQFVKFCGLNLVKSQSGQSRGRETLSKRGNKRLRMAFWMAGLVAVRQRENSFREKYERYMRSNPTDPDLKRKALTAIAAKMARVAYALIKAGGMYRQYFEESVPSGSIPLTRAVEAQSTS
jgi:transposase